MKTVGIPRAMSYYYLYPFYKALFEALDVEVILSKPTTKTTLENIDACPTDEPCLAVKLYFAHVRELMASDCHFIFLPKIISVAPGNYCCPKFIGIPEMIRNYFELHERGLLPRINFHHPRQMEGDLSRMAAKLGVKPKRISRWIKEAWRYQEEFARIPAAEELTTVEVYRNLSKKRIVKEPGNPRKEAAKSATGLVGHPYVIYEWIGHDMVDRFRSYGKVFTSEMISKSDIQKQLKKIHDGPRLWEFEAYMLGAALHLIENRLVDKLVLVGLFECGPESVIEPYIEDASEKQGIPLLKLYLDDQTGEAGLQTRIEAFMDTTSDTAVEAPADDRIQSIHTVTGKFTEPVVGVPSMGHLDGVIRMILEDCGTKTVKTPPVNRRAIEVGRLLAPEYICLPFSATLGQMAQMLDAGANHILMVGGKGRCRLGWYGQVQELLLKKTGRSFEMVVLDSPFPLNRNGMTFIRKIAQVTGNARPDKLIKSLWFGYRKIKMLDKLEAMVRNLRAYERVRGSAGKLLEGFQSRIINAASYRSLGDLQHEFLDCARSIELENTNPLKIAIVGEIWVVLEPFINLEIVKTLGSRETPRVLVENEASISGWFEKNILHTAKMKRHDREIRAAAAPFLDEHVGGHGQESVGLSVMAAQNGLDGVIHLFPFTCMPEIVAQGILVKAAETLNIPILSLIISEQTGEAGVETRLEAFLDLLEERRLDKGETENGAVLYRH